MNDFPSYLRSGIESKVIQRQTGNAEGTVKKSLIISFFLYGKQSKTSPVSTGDFSFPVTGTHISLTATYILPLMQNSSFVNRFHPVIKYPSCS